ncbi:G-type lectin S-receptor-like serine/threonine-protein kinase [Pyrus ussuriensis x Pyrus communis]|uniref:G-type lectin S-receptor-like serine/threonine-protein kinase n=1 Tax=Pyrus ussuriensis x Pyrus communis TaxID=2448454 RepID=A0A5N5IG17_9ROSA|nr:G-type lectin S-receptor-like serine/threonine-protein kinase [Pyrus ussuriensis x Pyrus communis]
MNTCDGTSRESPAKNKPADGSLSLFQAFSKLRFPDLLSNPSSTIFGRTPTSSSFTTKFPLSKSSAAEPLDGTEIFVDQREFCFPSTSSRFPLLLIVKLAKVSEAARGFSLLATHTTFLGDMFVCHIPTYLLTEPLGVKNPNSKMRLGETRVCVCENGCDGVIS